MRTNPIVTLATAGTASALVLGAGPDLTGSGQTVFLAMLTAGVASLVTGLHSVVRSARVEG